jgi:D-alanyl-D-alanine carboxypeptidase
MLFSSIVSVALTASLLGLPSLPAPVVASDAPPIPDITADRWIVYDAATEVVLASWNANDRAPMASVTKVMTAILVVENVDLNEVVAVPSFATNARGSTAGLVAGEEWTVGDLLIAMMVRSGNDAALTLGWYVGGESVSTFVDMMNAKARTFGMDDTRFANPNGLDNEDHFSTATDLLTLIIESQDYPDVQRIGRIKLVSMPAGPNGENRTFTNTNKLLGAYPGVVGLKTGDTPWADKVLLGVTERAGRPIYSVVMHSDDHFSDTRELVDWAYSTYNIKDRWLRGFYTEEGGGGFTNTPELSESHERRLREMPKLDDGHWNTSSAFDLPKAESIARWISEALPSAGGG